jgi:hypothetical protein
MGLLTREDGMVAATPEEAEWAHQAGFIKCYTEKNQTTGRWYGQPCPFWLSPEGQHHVEKAMGGYYTCPMCQQSWDLLVDVAPHHGIDPIEAEENMYRDQQQGGQFSAGGGTHSGRTMGDHGQTGEDIVYNMGEIPGYGKITWWHHGGALGNSPLDGATADWGVEVKTIDYGAKHHRFIGGAVRKRAGAEPYDELASKMEEAIDMGKKGVLGVLVLLDYRRSVADIYVKEFPAEAGRIGHFRSSAKSTQHLVKEVPFDNPLMNPQDPTPISPGGTSAFSNPNNPDIPF